MGQRCKPGRHPQGCRADPPPGADDGIFRRKAQSVQALAHGLHHGGGPHFLGNIVHMVLRFSAEPMSPQQMHTLQPRPERAQLLPALGRRFGGRRHLLLRFCCFFVQQKRMLLPDSSFFPVSKTAPQSFKTAQYISLSFFILYTPPAPKQALSQNLAGAFTDFSRNIQILASQSVKRACRSAGSGLSTVIRCRGTSQSITIPSGIGV